MCVVCEGRVFMCLCVYRVCMWGGVFDSVCACVCFFMWGSMFGCLIVCASAWVCRGGLGVR